MSPTKTGNHLTFFSSVSKKSLYFKVHLNDFKVYLNDFKVNLNDFKVYLNDFKVDSIR